jgi:hypothetical protein
MFCGLAVELRGHLDLLSSREQVGDGHPRHTGHLGQVEETAELLEETQGQVSVLKAVDCESPASELVLSLELRYYRVVHVLLLLT